MPNPLNQGDTLLNSLFWGHIDSVCNMVTILIHN